MGVGGRSPRCLVPVQGHPAGGAAPQAGIALGFDLCPCQGVPQVRCVASHGFLWFVLNSLAGAAGSGVTGRRNGGAWCYGPGSYGAPRVVSSPSQPPQSFHSPRGREPVPGPCPFPGLLPAVLEGMSGAGHRVPGGCCPPQGFMVPAGKSSAEGPIYPGVLAGSKGDVRLLVADARNTSCSAKYPALSSPPAPQCLQGSLSSQLQVGWGPAPPCSGGAGLPWGPAPV